MRVLLLLLATRVLPHCVAELGNEDWDSISFIQLTQVTSDNPPLKNLSDAKNDTSILVGMSHSNTCVMPEMDAFEKGNGQETLGFALYKEEPAAEAGTPRTMGNLPPEVLEMDAESNDDEDLLGAKLYESTKECHTEEGLVFLHIPKNAGTTIEEVAIASNISWGKYMNFDHCNLGRRACHADWHTPPSYLKGNTMYSGKPVFCVVRNPYERAISEYKYIVSDTRFRFEYEDIVEEKGCSKKGLNAFLRSVLRSYQDGQKYKQLCHMLPQSEYIWGGLGTRGHPRRNRCQWCTEVLHVEEFPHTFNQLMSNYGYPMRLEEKKEDKANAGICGDLTVSDLGYDVKLLLQEVYKEDFHLLNYSMELDE